MSVPLTTLPAILGRNSTNEHIFELGNCKQLSRKHAVIFYSDVYGGKIGKFKTDPSSHPEDNDVKIDGEWSYKPPESASEKNLIQKKDSTTEQGFFAITCMSKNKIVVDGQRVEQGETAMLKHGSTIKLLTFTLYFLLPDVESIKPRVVTIPHPIKDADDDDKDDADKDDKDDAAPVQAPAQKKQKTEKDHNQIEQRPLTELVKEFLHAVETDSFERKHSMISTSILQYAVNDAANDTSLRAQSDKEGGVSRTVLMEWIAAHDSYSKYVTALLTKLEVKSYQQNLSRALIKGGFVRLGTTGRHIKWLLPERKTSKTKVDKNDDTAGDATAKEHVSKKQSPTPQEAASEEVEKAESLKGGEPEEPTTNEEAASVEPKKPETPVANKEDASEEPEISETPVGVPETPNNNPDTGDESGREEDSQNSAMPSEKLNLEAEEHENCTAVSDHQNDVVEEEIEKKDENMPEQENSQNSTMPSEKLINLEAEENENNTAAISDHQNDVVQEDQNMPEREDSQNSTMPSEKLNLEAEENENNTAVSDHQNDVVEKETEKKDQNMPEQEDSQNRTMPSEKLNLEAEGNKNCTAASDPQHDVVEEETEKKDQNMPESSSETKA